MNRTNRDSWTQTIDQWLPEGRGWGRCRWAKRGQIWNLTIGGEHTMQYRYALPLNCIPETYWILLTNVTINK